MAIWPTDIAGVDNEDLACWSVCAKPALVNKLLWNAVVDQL
jgi:hypothetical protein